MRNALRRAVRGLAPAAARQVCPFERRRIVAMIDAGFGYGQIQQELGVGLRDIEIALRHVTEPAAP